jgi:hypothetical protein
LVLCVGNSIFGKKKRLVLPGGDVDVVLETSLPIRRLGKQIRQIGKKRRERKKEYLSWFLQGGK